MGVSRVMTEEELIRVYGKRWRDPNCRYRFIPASLQDKHAHITLSWYQEGDLDQLYGFILSPEITSTLETYGIAVVRVISERGSNVRLDYSIVHEIVFGYSGVPLTKDTGLEGVIDISF